MITTNTLEAKNLDEHFISTINIMISHIYFRARHMGNATPFKIKFAK